MICFVVLFDLILSVMFVVAYAGFTCCFACRCCFALLWCLFFVISVVLIWLMFAGCVRRAYLYWFLCLYYLLL